MKKKNFIKKFKYSFDRLRTKFKQLIASFGEVGKIFAWVFILALAAADTLATRQLFGKAEFMLDSVTVWFFSILLAALLEGIPCVLGKSLQMMIDKTNDEVDKNWKAIIGLIVSLATLVATFCVSIYMRLSYIEQAGGLETFKEGIYTDYLVDQFLIYEPILSSALAFVISWLFLSDSFLAKTKKRVENNNEMYRSLEEEYRDVNSTFQKSKNNLWKVLKTDDTNEQIPEDWDVYQREVSEMLRKQLEWDALNHYKNHLKKFNMSIESYLQERIVQLSTKSTIPLAITSINLVDLIEKFDKKQGATNRELWNFINVEDDYLYKLRIHFDKQMNVFDVYNPKPNPPPSPSRPDIPIDNTSPINPVSMQNVGVEPENNMVPNNEWSGERTDGVYTKIAGSGNAPEEELSDRSAYERRDSN